MLGIEESIPKAVVDTGPLLTVLTLNYVRMIGATDEKRRSILKRIISDDLFKSPIFEEGYLRLFDSIRTVLTTSHVIGELQGLQKRLKLQGDDLKNFWLTGMDFLKSKNIDEKLLRLLDMHGREELREAVCVIGPTDTGLIDLARKEGCVLLTDDERSLAPLAWGNGVDCRLVAKSIHTASVNS